MKLKNIKDQFEKREIQPSAGSWEKLAANLDQEEKKNKKTYLYWIGAVAAVLIIALMVYPLFNPTMDGKTIESQLVEEDQNTAPTVEKERTITPIDRPDDQPAIVDGTSSIYEKEEKVGQKVLDKPESIQTTQAVENDQNYLANNEAKTSTVKQKKKKKVAKAIQSDPKVLIVDPIKEEVKIDDAFAKANVTEKIKDPNQEATLLLAQLLGKKDSLSQKNGVAINPKQLLRETEWDIEADRRNRINEGLKDGLGRLKSEAFAIIGVQQ